MSSILDAYSQMKNPQSFMPKSFKEKIPRGYNIASVQQFTPEMMELFRQAIEQLGPEGFLARLGEGDPELFEQLESPALRQFSQLQGNIASRFSGLGGQGALSSRKSSGFQNTMNQAASDFAQELGANRLGIQNDAISNLQNFTNQLLGQRPYERNLAEKGKSDFEKFLDYALQGANTVSKFV